MKFLMYLSLVFMPIFLFGKADTTIVDADTIVVDPVDILDGDTTLTISTGVGDFEIEISVEDLNGEPIQLITEITQVADEGTQEINKIKDDKPTTTMGWIASLILLIPFLVKAWKLLQDVSTFFKAEKTETILIGISIVSASALEFFTAGWSDMFFIKVLPLSIFFYFASMFVYEKFLKKWLGSKKATPVVA